MSSNRAIIRCLTAALELVISILVRSPKPAAGTLVRFRHVFTLATEAVESGVQKDTHRTVAKIPDTY